ncbi:uncharacterized protein LOC123516652 [Portunus trituberculatus]|uniref:uncharacterized protein LOC123516652 n=1 Tax=Portunus trituberculatus TaxID=210409 RepID=UPI001E1CB77C|nr:uncharacterized protein LOC123516652 [Portunus trituberculatus]
MKKHRSSGKSIVYLDETWINQNYSMSKCWVDSTAEKVMGVREGFPLDFASRRNERWICPWSNPRFPSKEFIVMDNASYHSRKVDKPPTTANKKAEIQEWLEKKGVAVPDGLLKTQLLHLVTRHTAAADTQYVIDKTASEHGHKVVRLPPYHCNYNPIELIWAQVKGYVAKRNTFKIANLKPLVQESLNSITADNWKNAVRH